MLHTTTKIGLIAQLFLAQVSDFMSLGQELEIGAGSDVFLVLSFLGSHW